MIQNLHAIVRPVLGERTRPVATRKSAQRSGTAHEKTRRHIRAGFFV
ncbi:hypothetical protein [Ralstonia sp. SET104]|nr:hypothetical protein [Ralstonia sp. SET104]